MNTDRIKDALENIPVAKLDRDGWLRVGMALKHEGYDPSVWDEWSKDDVRYHEGECERIWNSFHGTDNPVTGRSILKMAQGYGWKNPDLNEPLDWDSEIQYMGYDMDTVSNTSEEKKWDPVKDLITFLRLIFKPEDYVEYVTTNVYLDKMVDKYRPKVGPYDRTAGELIEELEKHPDDLGAVIGDWVEEAGAWIQFNPVDGKGVRIENVTRYDYVLLECDTIPVDEQINLFHKHRFPIKVMVNSGGKSVHALVYVNAHDISEYGKRVSYLYKYCDDHDIPIDHQNKNANRKCRMPGVTRNGNRQNIVATNIGMKSWEEWKEWAESGLTDADTDTGSDDLPEIETLSSYKEAPELPVELISGILRKGHKMLISGSSKAGKSILLMELSIAIAEGLSWLGYQCTQGKVLYINLEIDGRSCINRFFDIYDAMGISRNNVDNISIWNLRGHAEPLNNLTEKIIDRVCDMNLAAIIVDPIYKVITGDENSATAMAEFTNNFDKISTELGCATIYAHHHSKGGQGEKRVMDRASGSGVFARDPDALLDVIELDISNVTDTNKPDARASAWRMESALREFANIPPTNFWYSYPRHILDDTGVLLDAVPLGMPVPKEKDKKATTNADEAMESFSMAFEACSIMGKVTVTDMANYLGQSESTVYARIKKSNEFTLDHKEVKRLSPDDEGVD